ncbi:MAG: hypothetical protein LBP37_00945 [Spirochaetaceae bacterium]|jgi:adenylate cyclase|nr:hypothetical protein [Spirochaetaceae bacterium]
MDLLSQHIKKMFGEKLSALLILMSLVSLCIIFAASGKILYGETLESAEIENLNVNRQAASALDIFFSGIRSASVTLADSLNVSNAGLRQNAQTTFFKNNPRIAALMFYGYQADKKEASAFVNEAFFRDNNADLRLTEIFTGLHKEALAAARQNRDTLLNCERVFGIPLLAMFFPYGGVSEAGTGAARVCVVFFVTAGLDKFFTAGPRKTYLISMTGDVLIHSGYAPLGGAENVSTESFIRTMLLSPDQSGQARYASSDGKKMAGAYSKLSAAPAMLVTENPYDEALAPLVSAGLRAACIAAVVMLFFTLIVLSSTKTVRVSLKKAKSFDEVNAKLKTVSRFADMELARLDMDGLLHAGAGYKKASVLLAGIESFTNIAEQLNPADTVTLLNDYVSRAAVCVKKTGGTLERFSDGIVKAYWGALSSSGSFEHDALNCIRSALMMRVSVHQINGERAATGWRTDCLKLSCGISSGEFAAGTADCGWRTEYALIGRPLDFAEIAKSQNLFFDTDILISESTWRLTQKYIIAEEMIPLKIEGRKKPLRIFALINIRTRNGEVQVFPATLGDVRSLYIPYLPEAELIDADVEEFQEP